MLDAADLPQSVHQIQSIRSHKAPPKNRIAHSPTPDTALYHETAVNEAARLMSAMVFHMVLSRLNIVANSRGNAVYAKSFDSVAALACAGSASIYPPLPSHLSSCRCTGVECRMGCGSGPGGQPAGPL